jgi:hypothetical protein
MECRAPLIGFTVVNAEGAWLADRGGTVGWATDPADPDIFIFDTEDEAAANAERAQGERVEWKGK